MLPSLRSAVRRFLLPITVALTLLAPGRPVQAAPETPAQARVHREQAKARALSRSVVKIMLNADDQTTYVGTGVYVEINGKLFLFTCIQVVTVEGKLPEGFGDKLMIRPYNSDPDDAGEWRPIGRYSRDVKGMPDADFAAFVLFRPIDGLVAARVAARQATAGDRVIAFGFAAQDGHALRGEVTGTGAAGSKFVALRLGTDHGDSGGPIFDITTGKLIGLVSSNASPEMTELFTVRTAADGKHTESHWSRAGAAMGADTLAVHLPAVLGR